MDSWRGEANTNIMADNIVRLTVIVFSPQNMAGESAAQPSEMLVQLTASPSMVGSCLACPTSRLLFEISVLRFPLTGLPENASG